VGSSGAAGLPGLSELQSTTVQQAWSSAKETFARALLK
jgi:hypothetical protein